MALSMARQLAAGSPIDFTQTAAALRGLPRVEVDTPTRRASPRAADAIRLAARYLGTPYKWGGADPATGFDCSGLVQYVYRQLGIALPRTTYELWQAGRRVQPRKLRPGDAVFFRMEADGPGHMGMYIGGGQFIQAPRTGDVVKISRLVDYAGSYVGARRYT